MMFTIILHRHQYQIRRLISFAYFCVNDSFTSCIRILVSFTRLCISLTLDFCVSNIFFEININSNYRDQFLFKKVFACVTVHDHVFHFSSSILTEFNVHILRITSNIILDVITKYVQKIYEREEAREFSKYFPQILGIEIFLMK